MVLFSFVLSMGALAAYFYFEGRSKDYLHTIEKLISHNQQLEMVIKDRNVPTGVPKPSSAPPAPPSETSFEIGGIKIRIPEDASWGTIAKILTTILGTFLGIKLINYVFRRLDPETRAA